jgi:hypothetical protein
VNDRHYSDTGECAWYSECKGSYSVYYIDLTLLFVLIRHFKREFLLAMFNDMFDCDEVSYCLTVTPPPTMTVTPPPTTTVEPINGKLNNKYFYIT